MQRQDKVIQHQGQRCQTALPHSLMCKLRGFYPQQSSTFQNHCVAPDLSVRLCIKLEVRSYILGPSCCVSCLCWSPCV